MDVLMNLIINWYTNHPYMATAVTTLFVSSVVGAMPSPQSNSGFYRFFFDFIHTFTGGLFRVLASRNAIANGGGVKSNTVFGQLITPPNLPTNVDTSHAPVIEVPVPLPDTVPVILKPTTASEALKEQPIQEWKPKGAK